MTVRAKYYQRKAEQFRRWAEDAIRAASRPDCSPAQAADLRKSAASLRDSARAMDESAAAVERRAGAKRRRG